MQTHLNELSASMNTFVKELCVSLDKKLKGYSATLGHVSPSLSSITIHPTKPITKGTFAGLSESEGP